MKQNGYFKMAAPVTSPAGGRPSTIAGGCAKRSVPKNWPKFCFIADRVVGVQFSIALGLLAEGRI